MSGGCGCGLTAATDVLLEAEGLVEWHSAMTVPTAPDPCSLLITPPGCQLVLACCDAARPFAPHLSQAAGRAATAARTAAPRISAVVRDSAMARISTRNQAPAGDGVTGASDRAGGDAATASADDEYEEAEEEDYSDEEWEDASGDEDDQEEEMDTEEQEQGTTTRQALLRFLLSGRRANAPDRLEQCFARLPDGPGQPLAGDLAAHLNRATRARDVGQAAPVWPCLDGGFDAALLAPVSTRQQLHLHMMQQSNAELKRTRKMQQQQQQQQHGPQLPAEPSQQQAGSSGGIPLLRGVVTRSAARRRAGGSGAAADADAGGGAGASSSRGDGGGSGGGAGPPASGFTLVNSAQLLLKRELFMHRQAGLSRAQQAHLCCQRLPLFPHKVRDSLPSRAYIGQYSSSGDFFIAAYQDRRVRLYDTATGGAWRLRKDVTTRMTRWTITDTALSPDQRLLVYASISPTAFLVSVGHAGDLVDSQANITELHEPLVVDGSAADGADPWAGNDFGIWSVAWSPQGGQMIAGTNDHAVYVYDFESRRCLAKLAGHRDDVNAVSYLSPDSDPNTVVCGSDDHLVRIWDLRLPRRQPQGVLLGHTEGITHLCAKGDGRHLISNAKDQTVKLWDVRGALSTADAAAAARQRPPVPRWDYRWEESPASGYDVRHPADVSLMTYRGHGVLQTLVRAYFSPGHSTGQRFIYSGSADGTVVAWDVVSGAKVAAFQHHRALVRDVSWHPHEPELTSVSWDGRIVSWGVTPPSGELLQAERGDVGRYY